MNWYGTSTAELVAELRDRACIGTGCSFFDAAADRLAELQRKADSAVDAIGQIASQRFAATLDALADR